jgi:hypothetical protein
MATLEGVCLGDGHLDKLTKYWPNANEMMINGWRRVLNAAIADGVRYAFLLGDVADGIRDSTGNAMRLTEAAQCSLLKFFFEYDGRIHIDTILGNHDWASEGSHSLQIFFELQRHKAFKTIKFHERATCVKRGGIWCNFLPYPNIKPTDERAQVAFAHYEVGGAVGDNGRQNRHEETYEFDIPFIQGHLHTRQKVRNHYYPGTLYQTSFGESLPKGYMRFKTDGRKFKHQWVDVDPEFKLINLHINKREDLKQLTESETTLYKLFVHSDVTIPDDLLTRFPNVVNRLAFNTEQELEALEHNEFESENQHINLDHEELLPDFLKKRGATKWQQNRAVELLMDTKKALAPKKKK